MKPKSNSNELRPLGIPTLIDRAVQAVYLLTVDPVVESKADKFSFGFRVGRSQQDAITSLRTLLDKSYSPEYILETDIAKCFDKISQDHILETTPIGNKHVLKEWLKSGYLFEGKVFSSDEGTPQGGIISPMLCKVALDGLELEIRKVFPVNKTHKKGKPKVYLIRYADDMIITGKDKEVLLQAKKVVQNFLKIRGLELKEAKTRIVSIFDGFDFLGFNLSRKTYNPKINNPTNQSTVLIIKPSDKAIKALKMKIKTIINNNIEIAAIIKERNPILRGWANYFKISYHTQARFIKLSHYVWNNMMNWVKRKHPNLSIVKATSKYIVRGKTASKHKRVWGINKFDETKENKLVILNIAEVKPVKHSLLKLDLNPYEIENREYFDRRKIVKCEAKFRELIYKNINISVPFV